MRHDIGPDDPRYPPGLHQVKAPPALRVRGEMPSTPGVAIVGARDAMEQAATFARALAGALSLEGFTVWSGGARGIDTAAHEGALDAGGNTVIVSGVGLDHAYPPENAPLYDRTVDSGGAIVSRFDDAAVVVRGCFLKRNEVLAAATVATIVVQADLKSGARSTFAVARKLGRPRACVPHAPWDPRGAGCLHELVHGGAQPIVSLKQAVGFARHSALLASAVPFGRPAPRSPGATLVAQSAPAGLRRRNAKKFSVERLGRPARTVLSALEACRDRSLVVDELVEITDLPTGAILTALLTLTLAAVVVEGPAGFYRLTAPPVSGPGNQDPTWPRPS